MITVRRLRRGARRESIGVDVPAALNLVGALLKYLSPAFLFPTVIALGYGESVLPFVIAGLATALVGWSLERLTEGKERVGSREGYLIVSLTWLLAAAAGAIPYVLSGEPQLSSPIDAYFESMSGFSTTGSSVLTDIEALNHSLAMWRQFSQWLGGMGIIVLALAVLPRLRIGGRQLLQLEAPGPEIESLTASIRDTAKRFVLLYVALTAAEVVALTLLGWLRLDTRMSPYEALAHAFTTIPTGGFSTQGRSIEEFGTATQWTIALFMILAGTNFALLYLGIVRRRPRAFARDDEFRPYLALLAIASFFVFLELVREDIFHGEEAVRHAVFNCVSLMTTTGYASADFNEWPSLTALILVGLMFISASAGSTSGSIKLVRHVVIARTLRRELDQTIHPELVSLVRVHGTIVGERILGAVIGFAFLYVGLFAAGSTALLIESARAGVEVAPFEAIAASATTLGGVGPGFGFAGPMGAFADFSDFAKLVLIGLMWLGRLEIIPIVVLFTRNYWRA